ncbi:MAG: helix-turn-helix domain-containing protein [Limisphaerales bacterium]
MANDHPRRTKFPANHIGPQIQRLRLARGWSQAKLAERLQLNGLDVGRDVVARIECQFHCVRDKEILFIARTLGVDVSRLFLSIEPKFFDGYSRP